MYDNPMGDGKSSEVLLIKDSISTLVYLKNQFWLCIGEVNGLKIDGKAVGYVSLNMLLEDTVTVSYQMLGLHLARSDDDPELKHNWQTYSMQEQSFSVPGKLIQTINPELSITHKTMPFYPYQATSGE